MNKGELEVKIARFILGVLGVALILLACMDLEPLFDYFKVGM